MEEIDADCQNNLFELKRKEMRSTIHTLFTGRYIHINSMLSKDEEKLNDCFLFI